MQLQKAARKKVKMKLGFNGPSGAGKTMSALKLAFGLTGDWSKIAVIDTENSSASLYEHVGDFLTIDLAAPFSPERYIEAMMICEKAGMEVVIIDSGTHEWTGIGGYLDLTDKLAAASFKGNNWAARSITQPRHRKFVDYILQSKFHVIVCNRSKVETVMGDDRKVKKIGMKEVQDAELEYELSIVFSLDRDTHTVTASKDRTEVFEGKDPFVVTEDTGRLIKAWCEKGIELKPLPPPAPEAEETKKEKPLCDPLQFTNLMVRIKKREEGVAEKAMEHFNLSELQLAAIAEVMSPAVAQEGFISNIDEDPFK